MSKGVYSALSGAVATQVSLDTTAQNLANSSTAGYQRLRPIFREALVNAQQNPNRPADPATPRFTAARGTVIDMSPGVRRQTGRALDVALPERTFLAVSTPRGERYTRAGQIEVTPEGSLRVGGADLVDESGTPIQVDPSKELSIGSDGQLSADGEPLARIKLVEFQEPRLLTLEGAALFNASQASGAPTVATGELAVGQIEESNSSPVVAMTDLLTASRLFDAYQRAIDTFRDADRKIVTVPSAS